MTIVSRTVADVHDTPVKTATTIPISSNWAYDHVSTMHADVNLIGEPGELGFGVGIYPTNLPTGFNALSGTTDKASDNYGNYQYSDGSVMCWIPKFYYRIGSNTSPRYATYGNNAIDIVGTETYSTANTANAAGYALHRAFIDGGEEKSGFFFDKYQCSNNANTASSIKNGNPLSTAAAHNPISGLTGTPTNAYHGTLVAAKTRGANFHLASRFQYSALALLATAHGQAASSNTYCAWYDSGLTKNYPKGNNNNALSDADDTAVKWKSDGYSNCGKTGSAGYGGGAGNVFAKSTHNGQNCGVADLNGNMWEVSIGMTCIATTNSVSGATKANPCEITVTAAHGYSNNDVVMITGVVGMTQLNDKLYTITVTATDKFTLNGIDSSGYTDYASAGTITKGTFYAAKESTAMKDFTPGTTLATDHWGSTGVNAMMKPVVPAFATASGINSIAQKYGNSTLQVLGEETSGNDWVLTGLGLPIINGMSISGTNLFGIDLYYQYIRNELCLISGGSWYSATGAGVWGLALDIRRGDSYAHVGFRAAYV